jgi:thiamine pyrophosphate-dependent acetolactate synthase large subunit-like protein
MVAQFQEENMESRFVGTRIGYDTPNFQEISAAFRVPSISISSENELESMEIFLDKTVKGPRLIEFVISQKALALPKLGRYASLKDL